MLHVLSFYTLPTLRFSFQIPVDFLISVTVYLINFARKNQQNNRSLNVKGSKRKRSNMMKPAEVCDTINTSPDEDILPSSNDLSAMKRRKEKNKVTKKYYHCQEATTKKKADNVFNIVPNKCTTWKRFNGKNSE